MSSPPPTESQYLKDIDSQYLEDSADEKAMVEAFAARPGDPEFWDIAAMPSGPRQPYTIWVKNPHRYPYVVLVHRDGDNQPTSMPVHNLFRKKTKAGEYYFKMVGTLAPDDPQGGPGPVVYALLSEKEIVETESKPAYDVQSKAIELCREQLQKELNQYRHGR